MDSEELLAQLADIHLPPAVGFWPPAPGWWILTAVLLTLIIYGAQKYLRYSRLHKVCDHALAELELCYQKLAQADGNPEQLQLRFVNEVNSVIRRVALVHFPQSGIASLDGSAWVDFIQEKGESSTMSEEIAAALSFGRFKQRCEVDANALHTFARQWISRLYLQRPTTSPQGMSH